MIAWRLIVSSSIARRVTLWRILDLSVFLFNLHGPQKTNAFRTCQIDQFFRWYLGAGGPKNNFPLKKICKRMKANCPGNGEGDISWTTKNDFHLLGSTTISHCNTANSSLVLSISRLLGGTWDLVTSLSLSVGPPPVMRRQTRLWGRGSWWSNDVYSVVKPVATSTTMVWCSMKVRC